MGGGRNYYSSRGLWCRRCTTKTACDGRRTRRRPVKVVGVRHDLPVSSSVPGTNVWCDVPSPPLSNEPRTAARRHASAQTTVVAVTACMTVRRWPETVKEKTQNGRVARWKREAEKIPRTTTRPAALGHRQWARAGSAFVSSAVPGGSYRRPGVHPKRGPGKRSPAPRCFGGGVGSKRCRGRPTRGSDRLGNRSDDVRGDGRCGARRTLVARWLTRRVHTAERARRGYPFARGTAAAAAAACTEFAAPGCTAAVTTSRSRGTVTITLDTESRGHRENVRSDECTGRRQYLLPVPVSHSWRGRPILLLCFVSFCQINRQTKTD